MPNVSNQFRDRLLSNAIMVSRYEESVARDVQGFLYLLEQDLVDLIKRYDVMGTDRATYRYQRTEKLLAQVRDTIKTAYKNIDAKLKEHLVDLTAVQASAIHTMAEEIFQTSLFSVQLTPLELKHIASNVLIEGSPAKEWWSKQAETLRMNFSAQVRFGLAGAETNDDIIRRVRGRATGARRVIEVNGKKKVLHVFENGVMNVSTAQADALVRTAVQTVSNRVLHDTYKANDDVIKGVEAVATLDHRTTLTCIARDGGLWDLGTGEPLPESPVQEHFPGAPPWHWRCRTVLIPVVKSWDELLQEAGHAPRGLKDFPASTRASMDGQVSSKIKYGEWLKTRSEAFQRDVLGPGRYKLFNEGKIKASQLIDQRGNPLTIEELKKVANGASGLAQKVA